MHTPSKYVECFYSIARLKVGLFPLCILEKKQFGQLVNQNISWSFLLLLFGILYVQLILRYNLVLIWFNFNFVKEINQIPLTNKRPIYF
jgi:hypothetical protein